MKRASPCIVRDPEPIALCALIFSACGLLLALESKIQTRAERADADRRRTSERLCALALEDLSSSLNSLEKFHEFVKNYGQFEKLWPSEAGFGKYILLLPEERVAEFCVLFDEMSISIARINRAIMTIPLDDIEIDERYAAEIRGRLSAIRQIANDFMKFADAKAGMELVPELVKNSRYVVNILKSAIS